LQRIRIHTHAHTHIHTHLINIFGSVWGVVYSSEYWTWRVHLLHKPLEAHYWSFAYYLFCVCTNMYCNVLYEECVRGAGCAYMLYVCVRLVRAAYSATPTLRVEPMFICAYCHPQDDGDNDVVPIAYSPQCTYLYMFYTLHSVLCALCYVIYALYSYSILCTL